MNKVHSTASHRAVLACLVLILMPARGAQMHVLPLAATSLSFPCVINLTSVVTNNGMSTNGRQELMTCKATKQTLASGK